MSTETTMNRPALPSPAAASRRALLWTLLIAAFLVLTLALPVHGERLGARATRTDTFSAAGPVKALSIEGVEGDVEVAAGPAFTATVEVTVRADTDARAKETLAATKISFENSGGELSLATLEPGARF